MTTPEDPFTQPAPPAGAPAPSAPGMIPGAAAPPAPASAYPPPGAPPMLGTPGPVAPPRALATWTIVLTGLTVLFALVAALVAPATVDAIKNSITNPGASPAFSMTPGDIVNAFAFPIQVGAFVVLALWWGKIRAARKAVGYDVGGIPAVEWWGWFIPFANFVLPAVGMRSLTKGLVGGGALLGWWLPFAASFLTGFYSVFVIFTAVDFATGELADSSALNVLISVNWTSFALLTISWLFLVFIVRRATARVGQQA